MKTATLAFALALAFAVADTVSAHGGTYNGPGGGGTPGYSGPTGGGITGGSGGSGGGTTGGGLTGGTTGGSGGATGGGPSGPGLRPTGGGAAGGAAGRATGRTTGRAKAKSTERTHDWDWWWELNDDEYLNLKRKVRANGSASENVDTFLGAKMGDDVAGMTLRTIRNDVLPAIKAALKDEYFDARSGAVIALGKIGDSDDPALIDDIKELLKDSNNTVREAACLGLAMLGTKEVVPMLFEIAQNTPKGKALVGRSDVLNRTRAFATAAIGLVGLRDGFADDEEVINRLIAMAKITTGADRDLQVAPALALGMIKNQSGVPAMEEIFKNLEADEYVRAHIAVALGKVGATSSVRYLVQGLTDKSNHVRRSCAIALGLLTSPDDKATIKHLLDHANSSSDRATKNFCITALGEIGSPEAVSFLVQKVMKGQAHDRTFAALALGVAAFNKKDIGERTPELVLKTFNETKATSERGAYAISLALMNYQDAKPAMRKVFEEGGAQDLKGHVCTALGLLEDTDSIPNIRELVAQRGDVDLRKRAAIALGLMRDPGAVEVLKKVIEDSGNSKGVLGAATVALGYIGDKRAVPILTDFLTKKQGVYPAKDVTRAFATVALGFLGDKDEIPLLSHLQRQSNFLAQTASFAELLTIL